MTVLEYAEKLASPVPVLVVEDNPDVALWLETALSNFDISLTHCSTGAAALEAARKTQFVLAFVDLRLPDIDGAAIVKTLKETTRTSVILMTGYQDSPLIERALSYGVAAFLRKPSDFTPLKIGEIASMFNIRLRPLIGSQATA